MTLTPERPEGAGAPGRACGCLTGTAAGCYPPHPVFSGEIPRGGSAPLSPRSRFRRRSRFVQRKPAPSALREAAASGTAAEMAAAGAGSAGPRGRAGGRRAASAEGSAGRRRAASAEGSAEAAGAEPRREGSFAFGLEALCGRIADPCPLSEQAASDSGFSVASEVRHRLQRAPGPAQGALVRRWQG